MYGWINECIEHFFLHLYGIEVWENVKSEAGMVLADGCWKAKMHYPDGSTYAIIEAGARVTNMSEDEVSLCWFLFSHPLSSVFISYH